MVHTYHWIGTGWLVWFAVPGSYALLFAASLHYSSIEAEDYVRVLPTPLEVRPIRFRTILFRGTSQTCDRRNGLRDPNQSTVKIVAQKLATVNIFYVFMPLERFMKLPKSSYRE